MALDPTTAQSVRVFGKWIGWFGNAIGLPVAMFGLFSFWFVSGEIAEKGLILSAGILIFGCGRAFRYLCMRA